MSQIHNLDFVRPAFVPSTPAHAIAPIGCLFRAPTSDDSRAARPDATIARFAFAHLIGLAFVLVLPFAGLAALAWFGAKALRHAAA